MILLLLILPPVAAGAVAGYLFGWRRGYWRSYDSAWYRREDDRQPARPRSIGDAPGMPGGER